MFFLSMANRPFTIGADTQIFLGYNLLIDTFIQVFLFHFALLYIECVLYTIFLEQKTIPLHLLVIYLRFYCLVRNYKYLTTVQVYLFQLFRLHFPSPILQAIFPSYCLSALLSNRSLLKLEVILFNGRTISLKCLLWQLNLDLEKCLPVGIIVPNKKAIKAS